jgi:hypothetical protein
VLCIIRNSQRKVFRKGRQNACVPASIEEQIVRCGSRTR